MTHPSSRLRTVLDRLPFAVDDTAAANDAFRRWVEDDEAGAKRTVDLWTYCYVCRYFLSKAARGEFARPAVADELITSAYRKVEDHRDGVRDPDRYANWVSVVCKNTFLNHMRSDRVAESIDDEKGPTLESENRRPVAEMGFVREAFVSAIDELPDYLQTPARLYFLEGKDFEEISEAIDKPVPTVRTYKHKAVKRLRKNETLREYVDHPDL
jgi:RNA polymerase sigma factor (sigma-70 family)